MGVYDNDGFDPNWVDPSIVLPPIFTPTNLTKPIPTTQEIKPYSLSKRAQVQLAGTAPITFYGGVVNVTNGSLIAVGDYVLGYRDMGSYKNYYAVNVDTGVITFLISETTLKSTLATLVGYPSGTAYLKLPLIINNKLFIEFGFYATGFTYVHYYVYTFSSLNLSVVNSSYSINASLVSLGFISSPELLSDGEYFYNIQYAVNQFGKLRMAHGSTTGGFKSTLMNLEENGVRIVYDTYTTNYGDSYIGMYQSTYGGNNMIVWRNGSIYKYTITNSSYTKQLLTYSGTYPIQSLQWLLDDTSFIGYDSNPNNLLQYGIFKIESNNTITKLISMPYNWQSNLDPDGFVRLSDNRLAAYMLQPAGNSLSRYKLMSFDINSSGIMNPIESLVPEDTDASTRVSPYIDSQEYIYIPRHRDSTGRAVFCYGLNVIGSYLTTQYIARI